MQRPSVTPERYRAYTLTALVLVSMIIVTGASVRLSGSGLGCDDWPNCTAGELIQSSNRNQAIEQINRLFTALVALGVIAAILGSIWRVPRRKDLTKISFGLVGGVLLQGVIGGVTVLLKLKWQSVAIHFLASIVLVAAGLVLHRRAGEAPGPYSPVVSRPTVMFARFILCWAVVVLVLGTLVTASGPHGGDKIATRLSWAIPTTTRLHSVSVWVLIASVVVMFVMLRRDRAPVEAIRCIEALLVIGVAQGALGYYQYFNEIPALAVGFHVAGAVAVFGAAQWLQFTLRRPTGSETMPA
jgi:heme a synthase